MAQTYVLEPGVDDSYEAKVSFEPTVDDSYDAKESLCTKVWR